MKITKILFIIFLASVSLPAFSQKVTKKVSKEICDCFDKIDLKASADVVGEKAQNCILTGIVDHADELVKEYKIDPNDEAAGQKVGEELGKRLVKDCKTAVSVFTIMGQASEQEGTEQEGTEEKKSK